jgi:hypothetical protein
MNYGRHPLNLLLRFILEMAALVILGYWGWHMGNNFTRYFYAIGIPLIMATIWGIFAVPNDPSRSGKAPVPVPGILRLFIEGIFFGMAFLVLVEAAIQPWAYIFAATVLLHYLLSMDRLRWLINRKKS